MATAALSDDADDGSQTPTTAPSQWYDCAEQGGDCRPQFDDVVTMRYGSNGNYTYILTKGVDAIPCDDYFGNPSSKKKDNTCGYNTANPLNVPAESEFDAEHSWTPGTDVSFSGTGMVWIRYGGDGGWIYSMAEGDNYAQNTPCDEEYYGFNPMPNGGSPICEYAVYTDDEINLDDDPEHPNPRVDCASKGETCEIDVQGAVLAGYGDNERFDWRFLHYADDQFECDTDTFGVSPGSSTDKHKQCYYQKLSTPANATLSNGSWVLLDSCTGQDCSVSHEIGYGTSRTSTWGTTAEWSVTVTQSVELGLEVTNLGVKADGSVSGTFANSISYQNALDVDYSVSDTVTCNDGSAQSRGLWQFVTSTTTPCLDDSACAGTTNTYYYQCVSDAPTGYPGPACLPGYCVEDDQGLCGSCAYN